MHRSFPILTYARNGVTYDAIGDYSVTPTDFTIEVADFAARAWYDPNMSLKIHRLMISLRGSAEFSPGAYGINTAGPLTNGIQLLMLDEDDSILEDLTDGVPIKVNSHWARLCFDDSYDSYGNPGTGRFLHARLSFDRFTDNGIILRGGHKLAIRLNDAFGTRVTEQTFNFQGEAFLPKLNTQGK